MIERKKKHFNAYRFFILNTNTQPKKRFFLLHSPLKEVELISCTYNPHSWAIQAKLYYILSLAAFSNSIHKTIYTSSIKKLKIMRNIFRVGTAIQFLFIQNHIAKSNNIWYGKRYMFCCCLVFVHQKVYFFGRIVHGLAAHIPMDRCLFPCKVSGVGWSNRTRPLWTSWPVQHLFFPTSSSARFSSVDTNFTTMQHSFYY